MEHSESIKEISAALCAFHKEVGKVKKNAENPFFRSKYADLNSILNVIDEPLNNNGLTFVQFPTAEHELTTMLMHTSGEWMKGSYIMTPVKNDPQGLGSVITYQRRYALGAILGLNIDDDDDGNDNSLEKALKDVSAAKDVKKLEEVWKTYTGLQGDNQFKTAVNNKKASLGNG